MHDGSPPVPLSDRRSDCGRDSRRRHVRKIVGFFEKQVIRLNELIGFEAIPKDLLENSGAFLTKMVSSLINTTYSFAANVFMMLVILYFMLLKGRKMERHINSYVPFKGKSLCLLKQEVKTIIFSNALGIPIVMLSQAPAGGLPDLLAAGHEQHRFLGHSSPPYAD